MGDDITKEDLLTLLAKSEARIDKTNKMVNKLVDVCAILTGEYTKHIDSLVVCRDRLIKQNDGLVSANSELRGRIEKMGDQIFTLTCELARMNKIEVSNKQI